MPIPLYGQLMNDQGPALDNPEVVDAVGLSPSGEEVVLLLVATDPWDERGDGTMRLQAKLKTYVAFAGDGQWVRQYPEVSGKPVTIQIDTAFPLGKSEQLLVEAAPKEWCEPEGISLRVRSLD